MKSTKHSYITEGLIRQIQALIEGNHARGNDVRGISANSTDAFCNAMVEWKFTHEVRTSTVRGNGAVQGRHYGYDNASFGRELGELCAQAANDKDVRVSFMTDIVDAEETKSGSSLALSGKRRRVHDFGSLSVHKQCGRCGGSGNVSCDSCSGKGKKFCYSCSGSGQIQRQRQVSYSSGGATQYRTEHYSDTCHSCGGRGRQVCSACGGSGKSCCSDCGGNGFFTDIATVFAVADPVWSAEVKFTALAEELRNWLVRVGTAEGGKRLPFALAGTGYNEEDSWVVSYNAETPLLQLDFSLKNSQYVALAVLDPEDEPFCFQPPPLFDDLLAEERCDLELLANGKKPKKFSPKRMFNRFREIPALDRMMQAVAHEDEKSDTLLANAVTSSCKGYVSGEAAVSVGKGLQALMQKVSPRYFMPIWAVFLFIPALTLSLYLADKVGTAKLGLGLIFGVFFSVLIAWLAMVIISPIPCLVSALISELQRRRLPEQYRQSPGNWAPLRKAKWFALIGMLAGVTYGFAAHYALLPQVSLVWKGWGEPLLPLVPGWLR